MNAQLDIDAVIGGSEIVNRAVLVSLSCSHWAGRKTDASVTKEIAEKHGLRKDAGKYVKELIRRDEWIKPIVQAQTVAREMHYHLTAPWLDSGGQRILPVDLMPAYAEKISAQCIVADRLAEDFCAQGYAIAFEQARVDLNGLFNPHEYPTVEKLRARFECSHVFLPLPDLDHSDVRRHMTTADLNRARATIHAAIDGAVRDCYERLLACVQRIATQLAGYSTGEVKRFTDSITGNLSDLVDVLPALNLTGDPALTEMIDQARDLLRHPPQALRDDTQIRTAVQMDAAALMARMRRLMPQAINDQDSGA